jgi:hypothetical protein
MCAKRRHGADGRFIECSGLRGSANQRGGADMLDNGAQRNTRRIGPSPRADDGFRVCIGLLGRLYSGEQNA